MPLKIALKPKEKLYIGGAVVMNGESHGELTVLNATTILREKDILTEETATSPCRRVYLVIQLMYMDGNESIAAHHQTYWSLVEDIMQAAPSFTALLTELSELILSENYYKALKMAKQLIEKETEVLEHAQFSSECI